MTIPRRRRTPTVKIGNVSLGHKHPVAIQSMTDTPTANIKATTRQALELIRAGAKMVRFTVNDAATAQAVPRIIQNLRNKGHATPVIGDFHFNGHILLTDHPACAQALDKYRINPGNVGRGPRHNANFESIIHLARTHGKPVRIGVNHGSLDPDLVADLMNRNAKRKKPKNPQEIINVAMVQSALQSAEQARRLGLAENKIVLSVKMSDLQDMVAVYRDLATRCRYVLHLGLTEAGSSVQGTAASSAALAILLQEGIGDTIRVSLTPQPGVKRAQEVEVAQALLQAMDLRHFAPTVISCPGCGRTASDTFRHLAEEVKAHVHKNLPAWKKNHPGVERLKIAVMGCVVNGPGESQQADIGISLPGAGETNSAPVYADGKLLKVIKGGRVNESFLTLLDKYVKQKF